jgi:excinuclease ABC subunit C
MSSQHKIREKVDHFPDQPGIYLMKDDRGEVIYVGKAKSLRDRVRSYFQESSEQERLITKQIDEVDDIDVVVAGSEKEAFILESNFIKQFRPKYNVLFRDDKSFVSIKIPLNEPYPRPVVTRRLEDEEALYFGPYANAKGARETLRVIQDVFPLRKCSISQCERTDRPCVYGQMDKCLAPCCADVSEEEYEELINEVKMFLRGKRDDLLERLREEMQEAADDLNYEKAAVLRDRIHAIDETLERQRVASSMEEIDRDIFGLHPTDRSIWVSVLFVRDGNLQDATSYEFKASLGSAQEVFRSFINQFYAANRFIPTEVLLPVETDDEDLLEEWLTEKKGRKVRVMCPKRGEKKRVVELGNRNARQAEQVSTSEQKKRRREMESLKDILDLDHLPRDIECFDISTLTGREAVGSMVVFRECEPDKSSYRRYRIKGVEGQDDFASMKEVIVRRYRHVKENSGEGWQQKMPDLTLVDGGKGQLNAAQKGLRELGVEPNDLIALAKARATGGEQVQLERVFVPGATEAIELPEHSYGFRLITRVRDEAHRFAINYHRKLRRKKSLESPLQEIRGVGEKLAARLMDHFRSLERISKAALEELTEVKGVSKRIGREIQKHFADQREKVQSKD